MHDWDPAVNLDYRFMLDVVADVSAHYDVDRNRIYQWGQSNGALFTGTVGTHHGELYAACVAFAGGDIEEAFASGSAGVGGINAYPRGFGPQGPSPDLVTGRKTPFLFVHGTGDTVVPPSGSTGLRAKMLGNGWDEGDAQLHLLPNGAHVWWTLHEEAWAFLMAHAR
jgi:predicted peptidase